MFLGIRLHPKASDPVTLHKTLLSPYDFFYTRCNRLFNEDA